MQRQIFIVHAMIVDANGTFNHISGYPKTFDSKAYIGKETATETSVDIAKKRAIGELSEVFAGMCKVDTRELQTVLVMTADGFVVDKRSTGYLAELPDPNEEQPIGS